ncbi:MAG: DUF5698 domain-containing protein [Acidobacteria bacterium]|nr:DUF5698 domain-containing protein [Acidobacteriota bacterium]
METISGFDFFGFIILPLLIFLARIVDQSFGILRIIFATKGLKIPVLFFAFFESFIWLLAVRQILVQLDNFFYFFVFAAGFASGNTFGIFLEEKLSIGFVIIRVVFQKNADISIKTLKEKGYRLTVVDALGMEGPVKMIFSTIKRKQVKDFLETLNAENPDAFYTIEDVKEVRESFHGRRKPKLTPCNQ